MLQRCAYMLLLPVADICGLLPAIDFGITMSDCKTRAADRACTYVVPYPRMSSKYYETSPAKGMVSSLTCCRETSLLLPAQPCCGEARGQRSQTHESAAHGVVRDKADTQVVKHAPLAKQSQANDPARCTVSATTELMLICGDLYGDIAVTPL